MLKRIFFLVVCGIFLVSGAETQACVGRILKVGAIDSSEGRVMAETLALLINERTGTTIETHYFKNYDTLYEEVQAGNISLLLENTTRALAKLNKPLPTDHDQAYEIAKESFNKDMNLIWLDPFKFLNGHKDEPSRTAILMTLDVMTDFPALPRLLNKLARKVDDSAYTSLVQAVEKGAKPRSTAMNFLNSKRLI